MPRQDNPNLRVLEAAVRQLGATAEELVFLGGCATGLLLSDRAAPLPRVTRDVDAIVEVASHGDYYALADRLRSRGFREDSSQGAPLCRWLAPGVVLDVMPTNEKVFGFGNEWYEQAFRTSAPAPLPSGAAIRLITAPSFLATKLVAFEGRGDGDYVMSHDLEDVIAVVDGRPELLRELRDEDHSVRRFVAETFKRFLTDPDFRDAVPQLLLPDDSYQGRAPLILRRMEAIADLR